MEDSLKSFWDSLEDKHPSMKIGFLRKFIKNKSMFKLSLPSMKKCEVCKMPTNKEICLFCRIIGKVKDVNEILKTVDEIK